MNSASKKPIRNYSKNKTDSPDKSATITTSADDETYEHRIFDADGQVFIVLPTATEATLESDDSEAHTLNPNFTSTSQQNGTSTYKAKNHYTRMVINGEDRDVCNEEGCTQSFKSSTSTSHKKKHTMMHLKSKLPETQPKPELSYEEKVNITAKLITSAHLPLSIVENRYFRNLTGLELTESFIKGKITEMHTPNCCPFMP